MEVRSTIRAGGNGTKTLQTIYGDRLLFVRYRYDKTKHKRYKTAEIIVDEHEKGDRPRFYFFCRPGLRCKRGLSLISRQVQEIVRVSEKFEEAIREQDWEVLVLADLQ